MLQGRLPFDRDYEYHRVDPGAAGCGRAELRIALELHRPAQAGGTPRPGGPAGAGDAGGGGAGDARTREGADDGRL